MPNANLIGRPLIISMLDDDLYKFTMMQAVFHQYGSGPKVEYIFTCRGPEKLGYLVDQLKEQIQFLTELRLSEKEASYMLSLDYFKNDFVHYLSFFQYEAGQVVVSSNENGELVLSIYGSWLETILWEVKLLALISELHFMNHHNYDEMKKMAGEKLKEKISLINQNELPILEFGTRRRCCQENQENVVRQLRLKCPTFLGTSNVYLAMKYEIEPKGTVAHEWTMAHLSLVMDIRESQRRAMFVWLQEYGNNLSIALSDTFGSDAFFKDFCPILTNITKGIRQDSGDPYVFANKAIAHYQSLNIDTKTKTVIFSDNLNGD